MLSQGFSSSPSASPSVDNSRALDSGPPMPPGQGRASGTLFSPPNEGGGLGQAGGDPMVQTMAVTQTVDKAFATLAQLYPEAVDPLAQLQQSFRQLITGIISLKAQGGMAGGMGMQPPPMQAPLPMQSSPSPGMQPGAQM